MRQILSAQIRKMDLPEIPFSGESLTVAPVNYFYGENGTGKTTLAKAIADGQGLTLDAGYSPEDLDILRFDAEYMERCFRSRDRIPGIFSTRGIREEAAREIRRLKERLTDRQEWIADIARQIEDKYQENKESFDILKKKCWKETAEFRKDFPSTLRGSRSSSEKLTNAILETASPAPLDLEEFRLIYESTWGKDLAYYDEVKLPTGLYEFRNYPVEAYMQKHFLASDSSEFASFIKALQAVDWVREGKEKYLTSENEICPFCGQPLPQDMEARMAELFDENYEQEMAAMKKYFQAYRDEMNRIYVQLQKITQLPIPEGAGGELPVHLMALRKVIAENLMTMKQKEAQPDRDFEWQDISPLLETVEKDVALLNRRILKHNTIIDSQKSYQTTANRKAWAYLADLMKEDIRIYRNTIERNTAHLEDLLQRKETVEREVSSLRDQIQEQESLTANSREAMDEINQILTSSRYQGFTLREKAGEENLYEVVYSDGHIAEALSEGEYRMLTFLYFCQAALKRTPGTGAASRGRNTPMGAGGIAADPGETMAAGGASRGRSTATSAGRQKVLVIDDPTSGLDQRAKKVVVTMIHRLAAACLGENTNEDPDADIEQIFLMTHDLEFYRLLMDSYDLEPTPSSDIAWFQMRKRNERTTIQRRGE